MIETLRDSPEVCLVQDDALVGLRLLLAAGRRYQLVLIDPPYCSGARREAERAVRGSMLRGDKDRMRCGEEPSGWFDGDNLTIPSYTWLLRSLAVELIDAVTPGSVFLIFSDWRMYPVVAAAVESAGWRLNNLVVWDKVNIGMGRGYRNRHELVAVFSLGTARKPYRSNVPNVIRVKAVSAARRVHPTEKPVALLTELASPWVGPNDRVLDLFAGSGSTGRAAVKLGASCDLVERSPRHAAMTRDRFPKRNRRRLVMRGGGR